MDGFDLLTREFSFGDNNNHSSSSSQCHQSYGNNSKFPGFQLLFDEPCVNKTFTHQSTELYPETTSIKTEKDIHSQSCYPYGEDNVVNRILSSSSCRYSTKRDIKTNHMHAQSYQSLKLPPNYYDGTYPMTVQLQDAIPNINILPERPEFSRTGNDPQLDACLKIKPSDDSNIKRDLPQPSHESDINNNQTLNSNLHEVRASESNTSHQNKKRSVTNIKDLSTSINQPAPAVESSSKENSLSSVSSECKLNCIDHSTMESESDTDIKIVKDLHQSDNISVKTEGLYSPKKLIRKTHRLNRDLDAFTQRVNKKDHEIQNSGLIIQELLTTNSNINRLEPHAHQLADCRFNKSGKQDTLNNNVPSDSPIEKQYLNLSQHEKPLQSKFVLVEDLCKLLNHLSKSDKNVSHCLYHEYSRNVNIIFVPLGVCDTIPLVMKLAKIHGTEIPNVFGLVLERNFQMPGVSLRIKFWHLKSYFLFKILRTLDGSTKNVIVLVYDVTQNIDVYDVEKEVNFNNLPILLVGNTSNFMNENIHWRLLRYRNERIMKDIYKVSTVLELSIESTEDIQGLFITAVDLAFRHGM